MPRERIAPALHLDVPVTLRETLGMMPIPEPAETETVYQRTAEALGVVVPEQTSLGLMLARLQPMAQHIVRGRHGLFPFASPLTTNQLCEQYNTTYFSVYGPYRSAVATLRSDSLMDQGITHVRKKMTLEDLAALLQSHAQTLSDEDVALLAALNGLPPYNRPLKPVEVSRDTSSAGRSKVTYTERVIIKTLLEHSGPSDLLDLLKPQPRPEQEQQLTVAGHYRQKQIHISEAEKQELFVKRDIGTFSSILLFLLDATPEEVDTVALRRLRLRAGRRSRTRASTRYDGLAFIGKRPGHEKPTARDDRFDRLSEIRAFRPEFDTPEGRISLLSQLGTVAAKYSNDRDALELLVDEGEKAVEQLADSYIALLFFTVARFRMKERAFHVPPFDGMVAHAYLGLDSAVRRYNQSLGYRFSSFALKTIGGTILQATRKLNIQNLNISNGKWDEWRAFRRAEDKMPQASDRELADALYGGDIHIVEEYRLLEAQSRQLSLDQLNRVDDQRQSILNRADVENHIRTTTDSEYQHDLRDALSEAFEATGLSDTEQRVLRSMFGLPPYAGPLTTAELATDMRMTQKVVKQIYSGARKKMLNSPQVATILAGFIKKIPSR